MISVVIPTLNEEKYLEICLLSLENQTLPRNKYEVIVVDGRSKDNTIKIAKRYADKVIFQKGKGAANARNHGIRAATHDIIAYVDADLILAKDWLEKAVKVFEDTRVVCVSGRTLPQEQHIYSWINFTIADVYAKICYYTKLPNVMGPHMSFKKDILKKCGGFNEEIPTLEDYEIAFRIVKYGKLIYHSRLIAYASSRRFKKFGYLNTFFRFLYDGFRIFAGLKPTQKHSYGAF
ncbi:TPA: glycosyltransferase [archaeon]|uniref:Glycosyltransferase n=1 Tax=Candidatus Naiadarchaeum limnaeum TaxID=2756139 RepID=A0A832UZH3_9ARCH|nr:glycosyltransferase [Candidatus Naiadarchaeum limnaeum]